MSRHRPARLTAADRVSLALVPVAAAAALGFATLASLLRL